MRKFLWFIPILFLGCMKKTDEEPASSFKPILMKREDLEKSVTFSDSKPIKNPGKIYMLGSYVFIVDNYMGVHIINNADPSNPEIKGFINVPGCVDVAAKGNYLYVDNATDLVTIDISNPSTPLVVDRDREVFPDMIPPDFQMLPDVYSKEQRPANTVIIRWE